MSDGAPVRSNKPRPSRGAMSWLVGCCKALNTVINAANLVVRFLPNTAGTSTASPVTKLIAGLADWFSHLI
ncbi:hypothetical protein B7C42_08120 [Nocardia cerradoensis]|uniref:Uncharacterized protein n=2 Tax=Nocardia cerradoensis TaxID=85688 RepID=A0A231GTA5_9NOCA|nr:hypothetical protein B7C42_08120 [Nocardia cerradoensis]